MATTCFSTGEAFAAALPAGVPLFSPLVGCEAIAGWLLSAPAARRFLVAMPAGAEQYSALLT